MRGSFFYTIGMACASGIFFRSFFDIGVSGIFCIGIIGVACEAARRLTRYSTDSPLLILSIACISFSCGAMRLDVADSYISTLNEFEGEKIELRGTVVREPEFREKTIHIYVEPALADSNEHVLVTTDRFAFTEDEIGYGDVVRVTGTLTLPESFATDGGRIFDYPGYLRARGVIYTLPYSTVHIDEHDTHALVSKLYAWKHTFMNSIERCIQEPASGLGEGVLLGVKRALGEDLDKAFRETGIIHIVVLSGYNIMIVVEVIMYILAFFFFPRTRMILGILCVSLFAILVGFSATVIRASLMAGLLIIARSTGRTYAVLRALILALVLMLVWNPFLLAHDPGFQLSFLATLGLILLSPILKEKLSRVPQYLGMREFLTATLATQIAVLPLILYQMGMFSFVAVFVNLLVLPMVPPAMGLTFLTGVLGLTSNILGIGIGFIAHLSLEYIILIAKLFSSLPFAAVSVNVFPFWVVLVSYGVLVFGYVLYIKSIEIQEESNPYADWVIEVEHEKPAEELCGSSSAGSPLPFR